MTAPVAATTATSEALANTLQAMYSQLVDKGVPSAHRGVDPDRGSDPTKLKIAAATACEHTLPQPAMGHGLGTETRRSKCNDRRKAPSHQKGEPS
jgi:hypothetical protein